MVLSELADIAPQYCPVVVAERLEPILADNGLQLIPDKTFAEVSQPLAVVVPGGGEPTVNAMSNAAIRKYVRSAVETAEVVVSVCTGALILASVGLLGDRPATTRWGAESSPAVAVPDDEEGDGQARARLRPTCARVRSLVRTA